MNIRLGKQLLAIPMPQMAQNFVLTKEYKRFVEFCESCRRYKYIGLCYGAPGVGKTLSALYYSQWNIFKANHERILHRDPKPQLDNEIINCRTIYYSTPVVASPNKIKQEVEKYILWLESAIDEVRLLLTQNNDNPYCVDPNETIIDLVIIDEADRLKTAGLEQLREIYDRSNIGLILIGMPGIEKRLSRYAQLYSRVGFVHKYKSISNKEIEFILTEKWKELGLKLQLTDFTDAEAIQEIIQISRGNFRLLQRLFTQIERILNINQINTITKEVIETAREGLIMSSVC